MIFLKNFYYKVFVNAIVLSKKSKYSASIWKIQTLFVISAAMFFNFIFVWLVIQTHFAPGFTDFLYFEVFPNSIWNSLLNITCYIFLPILIFNYYFIFHKKKYIKLIEIYPDSGDKVIAGIYYIASCLLLGAYFIIVVI